MIEIRNLCKKFQSVHAVRDLTLEVARGEIFCFLGPNGAGKTTTMKILAGLLRPTSGSVKIAGLDMATHQMEIKKLLGYIPDMPFMYDRLTPAEFMQFMADLYDIPGEAARKRTGELFGIFGLREASSALIKDLSHGMRQRLIYCATFLHEPTVLLIDEPLIGLDPYTIRLIKELLRKQASSGVTVFLTTHILALAEDIADRIGIILEGRLRATGAIEELVKSSGGKRLEDVFLALTQSPAEKE